MSGIDNLATGAMTGNGPEVVYTGSDFTGTVMPNQNVFDVGPGQLATPAMFGTDSINPLGAEIEESAAHEAAEPKGPMGEDID